VFAACFPLRARGSKPEKEDEKAVEKGKEREKTKKK
jgi:hypothetical protein